ncbi:hypothetical protein LTR16_001572 [Cryomyces antarcticus]|uniref:Derlin n=1 Tax=Cryomyces antarcticus TaxID=329879 RepID=A0ABR0M816_9PEZI|nr:hypothetical protein LTR39_001068 [Cryomyces antarcticus]KAK5020077.1 hypothetical protein LTR60_000862 [Cryomyces antarcticus]KAK5293337.1 hypothetical protein LTR16_001572 [Cryomyces antarcticus]
MAAMLGGGDGGLGQFPLEQWFYEMPVCTRWWTTATVVTSALVQCHILTPFQLFYSFRAVYYRSQRYARMLEESSGRSSATFAWLLFYAITTLLAIAPLFSMAFLGTALSSTLVYIWARRNPDTRLSFLGLLVFRAPFLPWVLIAFSVVLHGHWPKDEIAGLVVGHFWYYFSDIYPALHNNQRPLDPPDWWRRLFEGRPQADATDHDAPAPIVRDIAAAAAPELR